MQFSWFLKLRYIPKYLYKQKKMWVHNISSRETENKKKENLSARLLVLYIYAWKARGKFVRKASSLRETSVLRSVRFARRKAQHRIFHVDVKLSGPVAWEKENINSVPVFIHSLVVGVSGRSDKKLKAQDSWEFFEDFFFLKKLYLIKF